MTPVDFQNYVRSLGVSKDCFVILYDHGETSESMIAATFAWYLFKLYNHNRVTVINGGLRAWKNLEKDFPQFRATNKLPEQLVTGDFVVNFFLNEILILEEKIQKKIHNFVCVYILFD